jgi:hypothetical protein
MDIDFELINKKAGKRRLVRLYLNPRIQVTGKGFYQISRRRVGISRDRGA